MTSTSKGPINYRKELLAGVSTYVTLSYIFIVNPILLSQVPGVDISRAFFATAVSAAISTFLMGIIAKVPFAVAPAPSITTFFVSYVCLTLEVPLPAAMAAVFLSGLLSIAATALAVRENLIKSMPVALQVGIVFAVSGFLIATGLTQARLVTYSNWFIDLSKFDPRLLISPNSIVLYTGILVTFIFRSKWIGFTGAPLLGIFAATIVAAFFGIKSTTTAKLSWNMVGGFGNMDFSPFRDLKFLFAMVVFFIIDFFGGLGKYVGLFTAMGQKVNEMNEKGLKNSLYIDGVGNVIGGTLGASSLAVFISSAVGIAAGGRTGLTAIVTACLMLAGFVFIPIVGAIPVQAVAGILIFIAFLLIPYDAILKKGNEQNASVLSRLDLLVCLLAALVALLTYKIDAAILVVFVFYTVKIVGTGFEWRKHLLLAITTALLLMAVLAQLFLFSKK